MCVLVLVCVLCVHAYFATVTDVLYSHLATIVGGQYNLYYPRGPITNTAENILNVEVFLASSLQFSFFLERLKNITSLLVYLVFLIVVTCWF